MDKRFVLLVLIVACLFVDASAGVASQAETEPVIVGVPRDFYPEYTIGPDDRPGGFGVDVMNAVAKGAGPDDWPDQWMDEGINDNICFPCPASAKRCKQALASGYYLHFPVISFSKAGNAKGNTDRL